MDTEKNREAKVIGIISIKGGVGKTTTVSNLGYVLANEFNKKVLLVDANFSAPNLGLHLGLIEPDNTLHDVLLNDIAIEKAIYEHEDGFHILPSSLIYHKINPYKLKKKINDIRANYDYILIDSSPNLNDEILATMIASDQLLTVTGPDYPTLSTTLNAIKVAKKKNTPIMGLILNKVRNKDFELTIEDIEQTAEVPVLAVLNEDIKILEALSKTTPSTLHKPKSDTSIEYKKLAACILGQSYKDPRIAARIKNIMKRKVSRQEINRQLYVEDKNKEGAQ